ncbi:MAG: STM4013/SEN3800 family hydrolase [Alphaproteobacteria bacterium]|nr:STM4013/SEN3800 family hydrolase [Alphaproteobacteria bacterium]
MADPLVGDVLFVTLDTLRFDVAQQAFEAGELPVLGPHLGATGWEERHTPGSFTYAAHTAFFAGFLPTPARPGPHPRLFALAFPGSETIGEQTVVLEGPDIVRGLSARGFRTICIGGTGFFNQRTPLGCDLPGRFDEAHWSPALGVTDPASTEHQVALALERLAAFPDRRVFLFVNVSALHQPNCTYVPGQTVDDAGSQRAALRYVDRALGPLLAAFERRGPTLVLVMSDHGTLYGEDGYTGHRVGHPLVYTVPYAQFRLGDTAR